MKHFEEMWNEAETLQKKGAPIDRMRLLAKMLEDCEKDPPKSHEDVEEFMSSLLFEMAGLSKDMNVNVAAALNKAITDAKIDQYE